MIEQFISRDVWFQVLKRVREKNEIPDTMIKHWVDSPVSTDYLDGCAVGLLTYATALIKSGRTDKGYIHWLAQKTASHLVLVLHQRGFKPYGDVDKNFLDQFPSQAEVDQVVKDILDHIGDVPPPEPDK
jgi:hypothetical protein